MDDILETAWNDFYPYSKLMEDSPEAKKLFKVYYAACERFTDHLSQQDQEELDEMHQKYVAYYSQCIEDSFRYGFELGIRLMQKVQSSEEPKKPSPKR